MYFRDTCSKYSIPNFIQYSLPDGLWALSYMMMMGTIWDDRNLQKLLLVYTVPLVAITLELSQIFFSTLGTFDILDILSYSMAIIIYQLIQHLT